MKKLNILIILSILNCDKPHYTHSEQHYNFCSGKRCVDRGLKFKGE